MNDHRSDKWSAANIYGKWSGIPFFFWYQMEPGGGTNGLKVTAFFFWDRQ